MQSLQERTMGAKYQPVPVVSTVTVPGSSVWDETFMLTMALDRRAPYDIR